MEFAASHAWERLWLESDSTSAFHAFKNPDIIMFCLRNGWHNCLHLGINSFCSHIFREENCCADKLAYYKYSIYGIIWLETIPRFLLQDFY